MPASILLGCIIIAISLYLGLKTDDRKIKDEGDAVYAEREPPREPATQLSRSEVEARAREALEKTRPLMLEKCWEPAIKENPEPKTSEFIYDMTFDGKTGKAISRGVNEIREKSRADVGTCLRELPMDYVIEPPGHNVRIEIAFTLP